MKNLVTIIVLGLLNLAVLPTADAELPRTESGAFVIELDEYRGYFTAAETLGGLKAGEYEFVVTNKADKVVGFQIQNFKTHEPLGMFPLEPGETRTAKVTVTTDGVRFRCPINPTPWYDLDIVN